MFILTILRFLESRSPSQMASDKQNHIAKPCTDAASVQPCLNTVYAVGDIQGCLDSLDELMDQLPNDARLIFLGDVINRGPRSLDSLRRVKKLIDSGKSLGMVLGNHDLHLLAVAAGAGKLHRKDTIGEILTAPDRDELIDWLRRQPLLLEVPQAPDFVFVHAGIPPQWSMKEARSRAREIETMLRSDDWARHLAGMYGNDTDPETADSAARMRAILNSLTRMRYLTRDGEQDFGPKMNPKQAPKGVQPWFDFKRRVKKTIVFGHWSTLGLVMRKNVIALDTGCLWGGELTAVRLSDRRIYTQQCPQWSAPAC